MTVLRLVTAPLPVFAEEDLRFSLAWSRVAPGLGGWHLTLTPTAFGEIIDVVPPGSEFPVFYIVPRDGQFDIVRERSAELGGGQVRETTVDSLRDAVLTLCALTPEQLALIDAHLAEGEPGGTIPRTISAARFPRSAPRFEVVRSRP